MPPAVLNIEYIIFMPAAVFKYFFVLLSKFSTSLAASCNSSDKSLKFIFAPLAASAASFAACVKLDVPPAALFIALAAALAAFAIF